MAEASGAGRGTPPALRPPHRPSRRAEILECAIGVFGRKGYGRATVAEIAEASGVKQPAVYYHFGSKDGLLTAALRKITAEIDEVVAPGGVPIRSLTETVRRVYEWTEAHQERATLFFLWSAGATPEVARLQREFYAHHVEQVLRLLPTPPDGAGTPERTAAELAAARTAITMTVLVQTAWLAGGWFPHGTERGDVVRAVARAFARLLLLPERPRAPSP